MNLEVPLVWVCKKGRISNKVPFLARWCSMIYKISARRPRSHDAPVTLRVESANVVLHCIWARTRKTLQLTGYPGLDWDGYKKFKQTHLSSNKTWHHLSNLFLKWHISKRQKKSLVYISCSRCADENCSYLPILPNLITSILQQVRHRSPNEFYRRVK